MSFALNWLATHAVKRIVPVQKAIESAVANAKQQGNLDRGMLYVDEIRIDEGPSYKYFKPGAMGRSNPYKRRFSHISVILKSLAKIRIKCGTKSTSNRISLRRISYMGFSMVCTRSYGTELLEDFKFREYLKPKLKMRKYLKLRLKKQGTTYALLFMLAVQVWSLVKKVRKLNR